MGYDFIQWRVQDLFQQLYFVFFMKKKEKDYAQK